MRDWERVCKGGGGVRGVSIVNIDFAEEGVSDKGCAERVAATFRGI